MEEVFIANANLKPEESTNFELGIYFENQVLELFLAHRVDGSLINLIEAATLVGLLRKPDDRSPKLHLEAAKKAMILCSL